MASDKELVEALEKFDALLKQPKTTEAEWQRLFAECPYILSRSLPLRIEPRHILALGRPGRTEPDFVIHPEPTRYGSPRGIIELKPPQTSVLTMPRKDQIILTRAAATAVHQVHCYSEQFSWPDRMVVLGNDLYLFVIMGLAEEWADKVQRDVYRRQIDEQLGGVRLFGYDQIFTNYINSFPRPVLLVVPSPETKDAGAYEQNGTWKARTSTNYDDGGASKIARWERLREVSRGLRPNNGEFDEDEVFFGPGIRPGSYD